MWVADKTLFRKKIITLKVYIRKWERAQINDISFCFKNFFLIEHTEPKENKQKKGDQDQSGNQCNKREKQWR